MKMIGCCLLLTVLLLSCSKEPVKIGYVGGLSGVISQMGIEGRKGVEMAVEKINSLGGIHGHPVLLQIKDDENLAESGLKAVQEFKKEGIRLIIGHMTSQASILSVNFINQNQMLMISPTVSSSFFSNQPDFFFRIILSNEGIAKYLSERMLQTRLKRAAVVYDLKNEAYTKDLAETFKMDYEQNGGQIVSMVSFQSDRLNTVKTAAETVFRSQSDCVLVVSVGMVAGILVEYMSRLGYQGKFFLPPWGATGDLTIFSGKTLEKLEILGLHNPESRQPASIQFQADYRKRYGEDPGFAAFYAYDASFILFEALKNAENFSAQAVRTQILKTDHFQGLQGIIRFNSSGDSIRTPYFLRLIKGKWALEGWN